MVLNFQERIAKEPKFETDNIGVGGPINIILSCSVYNNDNYRKGYSQINWNLKRRQHETMPKMR